MNEERKKDLNFAYRVLCQHNLWRLGFTDDNPFGAGEVTRAINIAAGAILNYVGCDKQLESTESCLKVFENVLAKRIDNELNFAQKEVVRLRAILARHGIKHKGKVGKR